MLGRADGGLRLLGCGQVSSPPYFFLLLFLFYFVLFSGFNSSI
jgi:hypothetical protein